MSDRKRKSSLRVAVIAGGPSSEAEVSRSSARGVFDAVASAGHTPALLELEPGIAAALHAGAFDVAFPITHGALGEDGCLQGLLEVLDLPFVGSSVLASALASSKPHAKALFFAAGLPVAPGATFYEDEDVAAKLTALRARIGRALVAKPASGGSAIGVQILDAALGDDDAERALRRVFASEPCVLVERFVPGSEVTCGVLEGEHGAVALPPTLIRPKASGFYDFVSKYRAGGSEHVCPAPFEPELVQAIQHAAVLAHCALGCRDLSRVDFVVCEDSEPDFVLLEVNTLPGMTATSLFPEAAAAAGIPFPELCDRLLQRAVARPRRTQPAALAMP